jgi:hypothetical protein
VDKKIIEISEHESGCMQLDFLSSINPGMLLSSAAAISFSYLVYSNFFWVARSFDDLGLKV